MTGAWLPFWHLVQMKGLLIRAAWQRTDRRCLSGESGWGPEWDCDSRWECPVGITYSIRTAVGTQDVWLLGKERSRHEMLTSGL